MTGSETQRPGVAVVTGAAQGIGAAYATTLAAEGWPVAVADLNGDKARSVAAEITGAGGRAAAFEVDVASAASARALAEAVRAEMGPVAVLVNNAAIYHSMRLDSHLEVDIDYWRTIFSVNLDGALLMTQACAPHMVEAGWGRIVNQTSTAAYQTTGAYGVSKLALVGLTRGLAMELGRSGITVNAIAPGPVLTEATEATVPPKLLEGLVKRMAVRRTGTTADLLGALRFLVSEEASWVTGQTLVVDGGLVERL